MPCPTSWTICCAALTRKRKPGRGRSVRAGRLDQDYHAYPRKFHQIGFPDENEYALHESTYRTLKGGLTKPDLIVRLKVPLLLRRERLQVHDRLIDLEAIVALDDLTFLGNFF